MKKTICLLLSVLMITLCFAGCGGKDKDNSSSDDAALGNIEASAMEGKLDTVKYGLGAEVDEVKDHYKKLADDYKASLEDEDEHHDHNPDAEDNFAYYSVEKKKGYTVIETTDARFYYIPKNEDAGVLAIATDSEIFGFTPGVTSKYEVEMELAEEGETVNASEAEKLLLAVESDPIVILRSTFDNYQLDFYFYDNVLITTTIVDTENWNV